MALSTIHLGLVDEGSALLSLPLETGIATGSRYLPPDATIKLFCNTLPPFITSLQAGLAATGATLANGRTVETAADAIAWLLEAVQAATS